MIQIRLLLVVLVLTYITSGNARFYLPGVTPHTFQTDDVVKLFVTKLTSTKTQMPYDYYSLPFCKPKSFGMYII
jgi:transmembrane 9 superfamily protein 2/4